MDNKGWDEQMKRSLGTIARSLWLSTMLVFAALIFMASSAMGEGSSTTGTVKGAQSEQPKVPAIAQGELIAQTVKFTKGEKHEVYSGPGKDYLRAADGKAAVSTNGWIQVFGREDGWILIQYEIDKDHMRFGWISDQALPKSASVDDLNFTPETATLMETADLTDDPLCSQAALLTLPKGATVYHLSNMGKWAYVESCSGDLVRGFVSRDSLRTGKVFDLEDHPSDNGERVMRGTLVVKSGGIEADFSPVIHAGRQRIWVQGYLLYDAFTGDFLFKLTDTDPNGHYAGSGMLPSNVTSIQIVPIRPNGEESSKDCAVTIEW